MAVCNVFKKLTKETGTFLTFSQYMEDLTEWQTKSTYHKIVPSKFIAIDCQSKDYNNITLPKVFQEYFENACAYFKNDLSEKAAEFDDVDSMALGWSPEYSKTLFWNMMFNSGIIKANDDKKSLGIEGINYVGDINLQSYNTVEGMGYSEIYCHIPNEASAQYYNRDIINEFNPSQSVSKNVGDLLEGFQLNELGGDEMLSMIITNSEEASHIYKIDKQYTFTWEQKDSKPLIRDIKSFNVNMIVVTYDIWSDNHVIFSNIPLGIYITGLIDDYGVIQNSITKYVSNEDIYNSGTSYGLRICSRYIASPNEDNYIVKEVTCEDNNYGDLSRVLSQLSVSQTKMDEVVNKTYNTEQNYKNLLSIFKNSRTNVPYIKVINDESCWFVNGKLIGPSVVDGIYDAYTDDEISILLDSNRNQSFQIIATAADVYDKSVFEKTNPQAEVNIIIKWEVYFEGKKISPKRFYVDTLEYTNTNQIITKINKSTIFNLKAVYGQLETSTSLMVHFVPPVYFGELKTSNTELTKEDIEKIKLLPKYAVTSANQSFEITTDQNNPGRVCYAYPKNYVSELNTSTYEFNQLGLISDLQGYIYYNNYDSNEDDFTRTEVKINIGGTSIDYYVYTLKNTPVLDRQVFKFKTIK